MDNNSALMSSIKKLLVQVEKLKKQNQQLSAHLAAAEARAKMAEKKNEELNEMHNAMLLGNSLTQVAGGSKAARLRITRLIKEVDKCIALSNRQ